MEQKQKIAFRFDGRRLFLENYRFVPTGAYSLENYRLDGSPPERDFDDPHSKNNNFGTLAADLPDPAETVSAAAARTPPTHAPGARMTVVTNSLKQTIPLPPHMPILQVRLIGPSNEERISGQRGEVRRAWF